MRFITPGTTRGGMDGDMLSVRYQKKLGFVLRELTNEAQLKGDLKVLEDFTQARQLGPIPVVVAGTEGYALMAIGVRDGYSYAYATAFTVTKKHVVHFSLFSRFQNFPVMWEQYRQLISSFQASPE